MKVIRNLFLICLALLTVAGSFVFGYFKGIINEERVLSMKWGDAKYGKRYYGAKITVVPEGERYSVRGVVLIGPDSASGLTSYQHDCGILGTVASLQEAVDKYGEIEWKPDGLHIGSYFLPQKTIESHR